MDPRPCQLDPRRMAPVGGEWQGQTREKTVNVARVGAPDGLSSVCSSESN